MSLIQVEYLNPFVVAVQTLCGQTINLPVKAGKPRLLGADERLWKLYPISAALRISSAVRGVICLSFSEAVGLALASGLATQGFTSLNADARDALGKLAAQIVGSAKRDLPGGLVTISTPQVLDTHRLEFPPNRPTIVLPFETGPGRFLMQLTMAPADQSASHGNGAAKRSA